MNLKCVTLGEGSQPQEVTYTGRFHLYGILGKAKLKEQEADVRSPGAGVEGGVALEGSMREGVFQGLGRDRGGGYMTLHLAKNQNCALKGMGLPECKLKYKYKI